MEFTRKDTPTIMDGMVVRYRCGDFEISASRNGVSINIDGWMPLMKNQADLDVIIEYLRRAFRQYVQLAPNSNYVHSYYEPFPEAVFEEGAKLMKKVKE